MTLPARQSEEATGSVYRWFGVGLYMLNCYMAVWLCVWLYTGGQPAELPGIATCGLVRVASGLLEALARKQRRDGKATGREVHAQYHQVLLLCRVGGQNFGNSTTCDCAIWGPHHLVGGLAPPSRVVTVPGAHTHSPRRPHHIHAHILHSLATQK